MTNPTTPFSFQSFDPDRDATRLDQDFEALISWCTTEAVHQHHLQVATVDVSSQAAGVQVNYTGITWPTAFATGVVPVVLWVPNTTAGAAPANTEKLTASVYAITNTGCSIRVNNIGTSAVGASSLLYLIAIDMTFDVTQ